MPFLKLDTKILTSSVWIERDVRDIFVTALLMASPHEFTEEQPQLEVRSLKRTGFVVPPGWYGFVEAAGVGICNQALVSYEDGLSALEKLGAPDQNSRSQEFEGRRLVRINHGYIVLNYVAYREKDYNNSERCKRYRERKKDQKAPTGIRTRRPAKASASTGTVGAGLWSPEAVAKREREEAELEARTREIRESSGKSI